MLFKHNIYSPNQECEVPFVEPHYWGNTALQNDRNLVPPDVYDSNEDEYVCNKCSDTQPSKVPYQREREEDDELGEDEKVNRDQGLAFGDRHHKCLQCRVDQGFA